MKDQTDIQDMRRLMEKLPRVSAIPDFEELIQLSSIRQVTRLWREDGVLHAFAFVDEFNNLWFETDQAAPSADLEHLILAWGVQVMKERNATAGESNTLDAACHSDDRNRIAILNKNGFVKQHTRSLRYARSLELPIIPIELPSGFSIRPVRGDEESQDLVALHRAAFGTENMTVEHRLAIMRAPQYCRELDLVVVATGGELAAFCICGIDPENSGLGFTDPVGVHPIYRNRGLAKVVITAGMQALKRRGVKKVELGTSSENSAMVRLALLLGFELVSEGLWFSKTVV